MTAAILSIGDELVLGQNVDTNSPWLAAQLAERSILTIEQRTVGDDRQAIGEAVAGLSAKVNVLIVTGGLGPTEDDLTREALGDVTDPGRAPVFDERSYEQILNRFRRRGAVMPEMNRKQALRPASMTCLANANGTAPGLIGEIGACLVASLPGPPREMQPMFVEQVLPRLKMPEGIVIANGMVHQMGMGESDAAERLGDLMDRNRNPLVGITVSDAIVTARIRASGAKQWVDEEVARDCARIEAAWKPYGYGREGTTLASATIDLLRTSGLSLVTTESCTGGWLGKILVDVPGSSDVYVGGWITYSNEMKRSQLGVPAEMLDRFGAVSAEVACAMAEGGLRKSAADFCLSITGIAGPRRGDAPSEKPVGTVHIGLARRTAGTIKVFARHFLLPGDRGAIRDRSAKAALQMLRFSLLGEANNLPLLGAADDLPLVSKVGGR